MQKLDSVTSSSSTRVHPITGRGVSRTNLGKPSRVRAMKALWCLSSEHLAKRCPPARCLRKNNRFSRVPAAHLKYNIYSWRCCCYDCASVCSAMSQNKQMSHSPVVVSLLWDVKTQRFAGSSPVSIRQGPSHRDECSDLSLFRLPPPKGQ